MRFLFICHRFPFPPKRGGKIRPFNIIQHLNARGHEVHVASLVRGDVEREEATGLEKYCASAFHAQVSTAPQVLRMVTRLASLEPSSMGYFHSPTLKRYIDGLLASKSFDRIFVHCSSVAQYAERTQGIPKHLDFGDMDSQKWLEYSNYKPFPLSLGYLLEGKKLMAAERRLSKLFDQSSATTRGELETLQELNPAVNGDWFPNGVDEKFFKPSAAYDPHHISFIGRMDYFPNQQGVIRFVEEVFPKIRSKNPQARFSIVGAEPPAFIQSLSKHEGVVVTGTVPDVRPYVTSSAINVAPLAIARGTQNKILEAMAMGVPVLSSVAAAKGVDAIAGEHLEVSDAPDEIAEKCLAIMSDPTRRKSLGDRGRDRVLSHHSWPASMQKLDKILQRLGTASASR
jgi:polysaccharide biosynthesis protein PslH